MADNTFDRMSRTLAGTTSRRQALKLLGGSLVGGAALAGGLSAATAQRSVSGQALTVGGDVVTDLVATFDRAAGTISIVGSVAGAVPTLLGTLNVAGSAAGSSCENEILFLDLLGLQIKITAISGAGNLLGNLLCAVAGLLDRGGPLQGITNLLNRIFGLLG
jgi:hypothetical protein